MKVTPRYYTDWLTWAWERGSSLEGQTHTAFLSEVWGVFEEVVNRVFTPLSRGISLRLAYSLWRGGWDPLEEVRNRMDRIRETYKVP